jgi:hypothetical protein
MSLDVMPDNSTMKLKMNKINEDDHAMREESGEDENMDPQFVEN